MRIVFLSLFFLVSPELNEPVLITYSCSLMAQLIHTLENSPSLGCSNSYERA